MKALLTPREEEQFFFNANQLLRQFMPSSESKQKNQPGHSYFKKTGYLSNNAF